MNISDIKSALASRGIKPNKALGQNFLCDADAAVRISEFACAHSENVLEIGSGLGSLSVPLSERASRLLCVEIDSSMVDALNASFSGKPGVCIVHADFLKFSDAEAQAFLTGRIAVAANLPYYVTTPIVMKLLTGSLDIRAMALMVQREAAQRFFARPCERVYGPLSVLTDACYKAEKLFDLTPSSYYPQPDVDSTVVTLVKRDGFIMPACMPMLVKAAFSMRRKTLSNNLKALCPDTDTLRDLFETSKISPASRAEALCAEDFVILSNAYEAVVRT